jgi:predicted enzyme related to lactoylglutathione lyase
MTINPVGVTVDCLEPRKLADWWISATGGELTADYDFYVAVQLPGGMRLGFQKVEDPTPGKNRWHLDFKADDREAEVARLTALGASQVSEQSVPGLTWVVLSDPDGNQFCVSGE